MNEDFPIRWNIQKKEQRDEDRDLNRVKTIVQEIYLRWHKLFLTKKLTIEDLPKEFNNLRSRVIQKLKSEKLSNYGQFTEDLLAEVCKRLEAFIKFQQPDSPNYLLPSVPHANPIAFHSEAQLMELDIIQDYVAASDFCGMLLKVFSPSDIELLAAFQDGQMDLRTVCVGKLASRKFIQFPTLREFVATLTHDRATKAAAAKTTEPTTPDPTPHPGDSPDAASGSSASGPA